MGRVPAARDAVDITRRHAEEIRQLRLRSSIGIQWLDLGSQFNTSEWDDAGDWGEPPSAAILESGLVIMRGYMQYIGAAATNILINVTDPLPATLRPRNATTPGSSTIRRVSFALDVADNATAYKGAQGALNVSSTGGVGLAVAGGAGLIGVDGTTYDKFPVGAYLSLDGLCYSL